MTKRRPSRPARRPRRPPAPLAAQHPVVWIGAHSVGAGRPVYVIAEAGVNHNGDANMAHRLVEAAHEAGADAVKFQVFSADRLVAAAAPTCKYQTRRADGTGGQRQLLRRLELEPGAFRELKAHADRVGLEFLATPFGLGELRFLVRLGVPAIKIASPDLVNVPLLTAAARTGLPLIVSTGAAELSEIESAVGLIAGNVEKSKSRNAETSKCRNVEKSKSQKVNTARRQRNARLLLLHCVSAYPTPPAQARLGCIQVLARKFGVPVGFSDHTMTPSFGGLAVAAGAVVLEKHLTLDRRLRGPDHFFSLEPTQFKRYVKIAHQSWEAMGDGQVCVAAEEREVRRLARGSIVTTVTIRAGQVLVARQLAVQRPGDGIPAAEWNDIVGRIAKTDIPPDTKLTRSMLR